MGSNLTRVSPHINFSLDEVKYYLRENTALLIGLALILLAGYGFELFNLNLTIHEEVHAFTGRYNEWIPQGRWGMFLLHKFPLPQPVIPFVPLLIALVFHLAAILILMRCLGIVSTVVENP